MNDPGSLPQGVAQLVTLRGHDGPVVDIAWRADGKMLASASLDDTIRVWDSQTGACVTTVTGRGSVLSGLAISPDGRLLATAGHDTRVMVWSVEQADLLSALSGHTSSVSAVSFGSAALLASGSDDGTVKVWSLPDGACIHTFSAGGAVQHIAVDQGRDQILALTASDITVWSLETAAVISRRRFEGVSGKGIVSGSGLQLALATIAGSIAILDAPTARPIRTMEGYTSDVISVAFSADDGLLASLSGDQSLRIWSCDTGHSVTLTEALTETPLLTGAVAFHPSLPVLAAVDSDSHTFDDDLNVVVKLWTLDVPSLLKASAALTTYVTAKIVLVGDSGVGKTGLGWRLTQGTFKDHPSTHGQQFWPWKALDRTRADGTLCEAILWDLAGQPDYRLIHGLFLDDADLAIIVFDATHPDNPLRGVEYWLKQLRVGQGRETRAILVAARADRGTGPLTTDDVKQFCDANHLEEYVVTSALHGNGIDELVHSITSLVRWDAKPATLTTDTFKRIKDYILELKGEQRGRPVIVNPQELRTSLESRDSSWRFSDDELATAVGHLENHGYVKRLKTSAGATCILLAPDLLNNLAASIVLEARRNTKGLGSLDERQLLGNEYTLREFDALPESQRSILLDAAVLLFLQRNICFRETDPLTTRSYLIFPALINLRPPKTDDDTGFEEIAAYSVSGSIENVYASLVVLLGYTQTFTRTHQWQNHARYVVGEDSVCGFRLNTEHEGDLEFVLYCGVDVSSAVRRLFQGLFESFLLRRAVTITRYEPVLCPDGHRVDFVAVRKHIRRGRQTAFCIECGKPVVFQAAETMQSQLRDKHQSDVLGERKIADNRTHFEQAIFRLQAYVKNIGQPTPACFISYAWGDLEHERWVEKQLAADLRKAGLDVVFDKWDNVRIGSSIPRFIERIHRADVVMVVGTPLYRHKYDNQRPMGGYVTALEGDLIGSRIMNASEDAKVSVMPLLAAGDEQTAFPPLLRGRVYADFRDPRLYFASMLEVLLSVYGVERTDTAVAELLTLKERLRAAR